MSKTKHSPPRRPKPSFIKFSKVQRALIDATLNRQQKEFNEIIGTVYEDLGIAEKILRAPPGTFVLRKDFSGLDVLPIIPGPGKKAEPEKPAPKKEAGSKDN